MHSRARRAWDGQERKLRAREGARAAEHSRGERERNQGQVVPRLVVLPLWVE